MRVPKSITGFIKSKTWLVLDDSIKDTKQLYEKVYTTFIID